MIPALWALYIPTVVFHLALLSIASPTQPPRNDISLWSVEFGDILQRESLYIPSDDEQDIAEQCIAVPWYAIENIVTADNKERHPMILIEANIGAVMCWIHNRDMMAMLDETGINEDKYQNLYINRLLGTKGQLLAKMHQLPQWQKKGSNGPLPALQIFGVQMAAKDREKSAPDRGLVAKMAGDLQRSLLQFLREDHNQLQPSWQLVSYSSDRAKGGLVAIWKTSDGFVRVWITGAQHKQNIQDPVVEIQLNDPVEYNLASSDGGCGKLVAFKDGTFEFLSRMGLWYPLQHPPKSVIQLVEESFDAGKRLNNAKNTWWMDYTGGPTDCINQRWDRDGTLAGFINTELVPELMIESSLGPIICAISQSDWDSAWGEWKKARGGKSIEETQYLVHRGLLLDPIEKHLQTFKGDSDSLEIWGSQFSAFVSNPAGELSRTVKSMIKNMHAELKRIFRRVVNGAGSDLTIASFLAQKRGSNSNEIRKAGYTYTAIWQPPVGKDATEAEVWIWKPAKQGPKGSSSQAAASNIDKAPAGRIEAQIKVDGTETVDRLSDKKKPYSLEYFVDETNLDMPTS